MPTNFHNVGIAPDERSQPTVRNKKRLSVEEFQEYLQVLADQHQPTRERMFELMVSYAELQFRLHGGSRCSICKAHVRHVLFVTIERPDGSVTKYPCLCMRCLQAEKVSAKKITLHAGRAAVEYGG